MTPKPSITIKYEYSPDHIADLLRDSLQEEFEDKEIYVHFNVVTKAVGHGMMETEITTFTGATVTITPKKP